MSDYLSNLAARSLKQAQMVKPRLTSLFEPRALASPLLAQVNPDPLQPGDMDALEEVESETLARSRPTPHQTIAIHPESFGDFRQALSTSQNQISQSERQASDARFEPADRQPLAPRAFYNWEPGESNRQNAFDRAEENAAGSGPHRISEQPPNRKQELAASAPERSSPEPQGHIKSIGRDEAASGPPQSIRERRGEPTIESPIRHSIIERIIMPPQPSLQAASGFQSAADDGKQAAENRLTANHAVVAHPRIAPYAERAAPAFNERVSPPPPAPTIQVTIGRIEVRATPQQAQQRQGRPSSSPVMSLDEYLRQRPGGSQ